MNFAALLNERFGFTKEEAETSAGLFNATPFKAKQFILKEGDIAHHLGIVASGLLRTFIVNDNADDITTAFHQPGNLVLSAESFNKCIPSTENIVALEDSLVLQILAKDWLMLYEKIPQWRIICNEASHEVNYKLANRATTFQTLTAKERYLQFIDTNPLIAQKAPLKHIASYLGIDNATLSRIRKNITV